MLEAGVRQRVKIGRTGTRLVPPDYADAVENWARAHGGHATLRWMPAPMNCWAVILSYRVGDPRQAGPDDGEPVLLHDYWTAQEWARRSPARARRHRITNQIIAGNYAYELDELGVEGIIARLDKGNILSGRGQFTSPADAKEQQTKKHETANERRRASAMDNAGARARDIRRSRMKIPFLGVGIEFGSHAKPTHEVTQE